MMKKLGIGLLVVALAFFTFVLVQKGKIEDKLTALLHDAQVSAKSISINIFPSPSVVLDVVRFKTAQQSYVSAEHVKVNFDWATFFFGNNIESIEFTNIEVGQENGVTLKNASGELQLMNLSPEAAAKWLADYQKGVQLKWKNPPGFVLQMSAKTASDDEIIAHVKGSLHGNEVVFSRSSALIEFHQKRLFNAEKVQIEAGKGSISLGQDSYSAVFDGVKINQSLLISAHFQAQKAPTWHGDLQFNTFHPAEHSELRVQFERSNNGQTNYLFNGWNLDTETWLKAFNIPTLVSGQANFKARLMSDSMLPMEGEIQAEIKDGVISGLSLLELISQYVPINYNEEQLQQKETSTKFEHFEAHFHWNPAMLQIENAELRHPRFVVRSVGDIDLVHGQCNVNSDISVNDARYDALRLPVHFFGDCKSPQYKVKFNRTFRDQLKEFIREKLK